MRRIVARFGAESDARDAEVALRKRNLEPDRLETDVPFFDPTASLPESRGIAWGALIGGVVGLLFFLAVEVDAIWVPRWSPMMSAGEYAIPFLGLGLGVAVGGFVGGVVGAMRPIPEPAGPAIAVEVADDRVDRVVDDLRSHGAVAVGSRATSHENPMERRASRTGRGDDTP